MFAIKFFVLLKFLRPTPLRLNEPDLTKRVSLWNFRDTPLCVEKKFQKQFLDAFNLPIGRIQNRVSRSEGDSFKWKIYGLKLRVIVNQFFSYTFSNRRENSNEYFIEYFIEEIPQRSILGADVATLSIVFDYNSHHWWRCDAKPGWIGTAGCDTRMVRGS